MKGVLSYLRSVWVVRGCLSGCLGYGYGGVAIWEASEYRGAPGWRVGGSPTASASWASRRQRHHGETCVNFRSEGAPENSDSTGLKGWWAQAPPSETPGQRAAGSLPAAAQGCKYGRSDGFAERS